MTVGDSLRHRMQGLLTLARPDHVTILASGVVASEMPRIELSRQIAGVEISEFIADAQTHLIAALGYPREITKT